MNVAAPFIRRPVATTLIQLAIVIFGIAAYRALPVSDLPPIDFLLRFDPVSGARPERGELSVNALDFAPLVALADHRYWPGFLRASRAGLAARLSWRTG